MHGAVRYSARVHRDDFTVRFWGVRGSIACPGAGTVRYGGNTSSIEVRCGARLIMFDGGTRIRNLGNRLVAEAPSTPTCISPIRTSITSAALPFSPFLPAAEHLRVWAGHLEDGMTLKGCWSNS